MFILDIWMIEWKLRFFVSFRVFLVGKLILIRISSYDGREVGNSINRVENDLLGGVRGWGYEYVWLWIRMVFENRNKGIRWMISLFLSGVVLGFWDF